ncbi:MAG: sigma-54-dependent transcriptional regulator, partial [bacterium]
MFTNTKIFVIDDDVSNLEYLQNRLKKLGLTFFSTHDSLKALDLIVEVHPDIVLTDLMMPEKDGFTILKEVQDFDSNILTIIFTAFATIDSAIKAMKSGAFDYLQKPYTIEQLKIVLQKAVKFQKLRNDNFLLRRQIKKSKAFDNMIGKSKVIKNIFEQVVRISHTDANVMIYGESGTGKELLARSIHARSQRSSNPFIPVDCVALPDSLLESELFGHEKGAFTGAEFRRKGLLEYAHKGTIFLDEICELAPNLQAKLLRVLQEREFRRVGGNELIKVDLRILSATNQNPEQAVKDGLFREDLYYRLNVIPFEIPPLRERKQDVPLLVHHFLELFGGSKKRKRKTIGPVVMNALTNYSWPGNVRELRNIIECIMSLTDGDKEIQLSDLPHNFMDSNNHKTISCSHLKDLSFLDAKKRLLSDFEKEYFSNLLKDTNGNNLYVYKT